jgi:two-component system, OmpR family, alkaline phosphatase synthesis response regulator PhoP
MTKPVILVVEDEEDILEVVEYNLKKEGFVVHSASTGEEGLRQARQLKPHVLILDLMLPGIDGFDICKLLKSDNDTHDIIILILSAKGEEEDVVKGLEIGADDYLTKPFSPRVLSARVRTLLRRAQTSYPVEEGGQIVVDKFSLDPGRHEVFIDGSHVDLTSTEFKILHLLMKKAGWVFTRYQIVDNVHGEDYPVTDRSVDVQIAGLRKKLGEWGTFIETVRGVGYRFRDVSVAD